MQPENPEAVAHQKAVETAKSGPIGALLDASIEFTARYVVMQSESEQVALALFVAHSYAIDGAHATPYLLVTSPERESGKTRLLETIELLVARPWRLTGASEAAMFRKIAKDKPTLMLDEIDAVFGSHSERTEPLRAILNAGNRPGSCVSRCAGEKMEVEDYSVYCPKILAGIDTGKRIPETVRGRSITIRMQRKVGAEKVERFKYREARELSGVLRSRLEDWAESSSEVLLAADPGVPDGLGDRAAEGWEALLAIAEMAGGEWPEKARRAALALSAPEEDEDQTNGALLLGAIRDALGTKDRITTTELLAAINKNEELPFGGWRDEKGLDGRTLAKLLKPYGVKPRTIKLSDDHTAKGYLREHLTEPWDRWLPPPVSRGNQRNCVTEPPTDLFAAPHEQAEVTAVTAVTPLAGVGDGNGVVMASPEEEAERERLEPLLEGAWNESRPSFRR